MKPWLITFGPLVIPTDARDELTELAHNRTPKAYLGRVWALRNGGQLRGKAAGSIAWPATCRTEQGYVLRTPETTVTPLRKRG